MTLRYLPRVLHPHSTKQWYGFILWTLLLVGCKWRKDTSLSFRSVSSGALTWICPPIGCSWDSVQHDTILLRCGELRPPGPIWCIFGNRGRCMSFDEWNAWKKSSLHEEMYDRFYITLFTTQHIFKRWKWAEKLSGNQVSFTCFYVTWEFFDFRKPLLLVSL